MNMGFQTATKETKSKQNSTEKKQLENTLQKGRTRNGTTGEQSLENNYSVHHPETQWTCQIVAKEPLEHPLNVGPTRW